MIPITNNKYEVPDISNISEGQVIKNYKELCHILNIKQKTGKSKQIQLNNLDRYFIYHKVGHKFIIEKVYDEPQPRPATEDDFVNDIQKLILDMLVQSKDNQVFLSKYMLLEELMMINMNYKHYKHRTLRLSEFLDISKKEIEDFYSSSDNTLIRYLEKALNKLHTKALINWSLQLTLCYLETYIETNQNNKVKGRKHTEINKYGEEINTYDAAESTKRIMYRKATTKEGNQINHIIREQLKKYNCDDIHDLYKVNKVKKFYNELKEILFDEFNIINYFYSYEINFNEDHVFEKWEELESLRLEYLESLDSKESVNEGIIYKINKHATNRQNRAINKLPTTEIIEIRSDEKYLDNSNKLTYTLINKNAKDIRAGGNKLKHK